MPHQHLRANAGAGRLRRGDRLRQVRGNEQTRRAMPAAPGQRSELLEQIAAWESGEAPETFPSGV